MTSWGSKYNTKFNPYWIFGGKCPYLHRNHRRLVELVAKAIFHLFPDRTDRRLSIGDCSPMSGDCSGHPIGSHSNKRSIDLNYYTFGPSNSSHYTSGVEGDIEYKMVWIWDIEDYSKRELIGYPETFLENIYDWERNYKCWEMLLEVFPRASITTNSCLKDYMKSLIHKHYGYNASQNFFLKIGSDEGRKYNHHLHTHINLGGNINWDLDIKHWGKLNRIRE